jgi:hypothetical protein
MRAIRKFWRGHGTKVLGYVAAAIPSLLTIQGLIPMERRKWWEAAGILIGLLIVHRGHQNSANTKAEP